MSMIVHGSFLGNIDLDRPVTEQAIACEAMGAIFAAAACIRTIEHHGVRHLTSELIVIIRRDRSCSGWRCACDLRCCISY